MVLAGAGMLAIQCPSLCVSHPWSSQGGAGVGVGKVCPGQVAQGLALLSPALMTMIKLLGKGGDISQGENFSRC